MHQLFDIVQKWDSMSGTLPQVVQRLVALKQLHEQGKNQTVLRGIGSNCFAVGKLAVLMLHADWGAFSSDLAGGVSDVCFHAESNGPAF